MYPKLTSGILLVSLLSACGGGGGSAVTPIDTATGSNNGSPTTPTNLTTISENSRIIVKWDAVNNADSYKLSWSDTKGQATSGNLEAIATGTEFDHEFLADKKQRLTTGVAYYYSVVAVNAKGSSDPSSETEGRLKNKPWIMPLLNSITAN